MKKRPLILVTISTEEHDPAPFSEKVLVWAREFRAFKFKSEPARVQEVVAGMIERAMAAMPPDEEPAD